MQIIHRFTPPTCTLEIWGKNSPLSRWTKQQVIKNLGFQLRFDDPRIPEEEQVTISGDREQLEKIYDLVLDYTENFLQQSFVPNSFTSSLISEEKTIDETSSFSTQRLVNHELHLGDSLAVNSPQNIKLDALQLFDLVSALEEYKTQIAAVAELEKSKTPAIFPLWTKIAAVLVLAIGVTNVTLQLTKEPTIEESTVSLQEEPQPLADVTEVIPPQIPEKEQKSTPTPQPKLTEPLSSANTLPPPPAIDVPKPPPDIPNPEDYPLPEVGTLVAPEITSFSDLQPPPLETPSTTPSESSSPQVESTIIVPPEEEEASSRSLEIPANNATSPDATVNQEARTNQQEPIALNPEKTIDEYIRDRLSREDLANSTTPESNSNLNPELTAKKPDSNIPEISQAKEAKSYFEQKWQPPAELTRTLEYRLVLNKNGSIQRIIPIGKASEIYIDRTNLPLRGEAFVSPLKNSDQATIRLLLSPDGEVNTFLE